MATAPEFAPIFAALRGLLQRQAGTLSVTKDTPTCFCLEGGVHPIHKKPMPIAWVQIQKRYVSFHHMGVYAHPAVVTSASKALRARMQGKACFNFKAMDHALFAELEDVVVQANAAFRKAGYMA